MLVKGTVILFLYLLFMFVSLLKGEACWWTIHPASKQRSEGEKVRIGDDLILVSVSSERFLVRKKITLHLYEQCFLRIIMCFIVHFIVSLEIV